MSEKLVVVGAGHATGQLIASLKQHQYDGQITIIGDEPHLPYQRPPLSKKFLAGELEAGRLSVKPPSFYEDGKLTLHLDSCVETIDRERGIVQIAAGDAISWDRLVIATGSRVRRIDIPGANLDGVHYLRNIRDVEGIQEDSRNAKRAVIVGAGYIGLEVAAVLRQAGLDITIVEMADRVMSRVVSPEISDFYQIEHANRGVRLRLSTGVAAIRGDDRATGVETTDGEVLPADFVVVGVGILPNTELAKAAGLLVDDGIVVDDACRTNDDRVFAIGDCTKHPNSIYGRKLRLESVHNALEQAKTAASNLCGSESRYAQVPWFWSDQYDLKLQIAGLSAGYDDVVIRGNPADRSFACLYLRNGVLIATDAVNAPRDFMQSKALIAARTKFKRTDLADTTTPLKELAASS